ncbi:MAG: thiol:disulfide interchange protein DsbA/DsbL [Gammaproteobacteria bacterium]|nr:thiol:disulfide interchange protein DsbA/DsbL [Gammaproteobacteria bacterium]
MKARTMAFAANGRAVCDGLVAAWMKAACAMLFALAAPAAFAQDFIEGQHYQRLEQPQPTETGDKVEVREFFWYGCPHCYVLEPYLDNWQVPDSAEFIRTPATFNELWATHARVYYVLQEMKKLDELHAVFFDALHKRKLRLTDAASIARFFEGHGIAADKFQSAWRSFLVDTKVGKADKAVRAYGLKSVPSFVVNGKYLVSPSTVTSYAQFIEVLDYLIALEAR